MVTALIEPGSVTVRTDVFSYVVEAIENYVPMTIEGINERYSRSVLLEGLDNHVKYNNSIVLAIGVGAVTTHFIDACIRKSIPIIVVDGDLVSLHNLERTSIFAEQDVGKPKVDAVKRFAKETNPKSLVVPVYANFQDFIYVPYVYQALRKHVKVVATGLDNGYAIYHAWLFSIRNNIPHVDASTWMHSSHCFVFPNPRDGPCYLCTVTKSFYADISAVRSCTRESTMGHAFPSYAISSKLAGDLLFTESCRLLRGETPDYNELRFVTSDMYFEKEGILPSRSHNLGHFVFGRV